MNATTGTNPCQHIAHSKPLAALIHRVGTDAALRHIRTLGIPFEDAYWMMFGQYPRGTVGG